MLCNEFYIYIKNSLKNIYPKKKIFLYNKTQKKKKIKNYK